mmetsp:Transcript_13321/g.18573  ORF Transcript_13321/g.18573 Transcript_13321/m.18573 type:complete len:288 (+) Transcript_13321:422-1285(+)
MNTLVCAVVRSLISTSATVPLNTVPNASTVLLPESTSLSTTRPPTNNTPSNTLSTTRENPPVNPRRWTLTLLLEETEPTPVLPSLWMPDNTTSPLLSKSVLRSLRRRWNSTKRWLRCMLVMMFPPISTDGSSPSTTTLVLEPEPLSTVPPSSNTKRPSVTAPVTRLPEERSLRSRPTPSLNTTVPVVSKDVLFSLVMLLVMLLSALEKVSTLLPSLDAWLLKKLSSLWMEENTFLPKLKLKRLTSRNTMDFTDLLTLSLMLFKRSSTQTTVPAKLSLSSVTPNTSNK